MNQFQFEIERVDQKTIVEKKATIIEELQNTLFDQEIKIIFDKDFKIKAKIQKF